MSGQTTHDMQVEHYASEYESPLDVAFVRFRGPYSSAAPNAWEQFVRHCQQQGLFFKERSALGLLSSKEKWESRKS